MPFLGKCGQDRVDPVVVNVGQVQEWSSVAQVVVRYETRNHREGVVGAGRAPSLPQAVVWSWPNLTTPRPPLPHCSLAPASSRPGDRSRPSPCRYPISFHAHGGCKTRCTRKPGPAPDLEPDIADLDAVYGAYGRRCYSLALRVVTTFACSRSASRLAAPRPPCPAAFSRLGFGQAGMK